MEVQRESERSLLGVPEMIWARNGNVVAVGTFPKGFSARVIQTESGLWRLWMYQGNLVKRRWRNGESLPRPEADDGQ